jgi:hypothetical protein
MALRGARLGRQQMGLDKYDIDVILGSKEKLALGTR